jgi:hypothetical protein
MYRLSGHTKYSTDLGEADAVTASTCDDLALRVLKDATLAGYGPQQLKVLLSGVPVGSTPAAGALRRVHPCVP